MLETSTQQAPQAVFMIRPAAFAANAETAESNAFQQIDDMKEDVAILAMAEFDAFVASLQKHRIRTIVFQDTVTPPKPDSVFPNNWISLHQDGTVFLYPMEAKSRRLERRPELVKALEKDYGFYVKEVVDLSEAEQEQKYLEGTGSVVFDYVNKKAYACISSRTNEAVLDDVCTRIGFEKVIFTAEDREGKAVYHTNVVMCIAENIAIICLQAITDQGERKKVVDSLTAGNHEIIDISFEQLYNFAGNMLEVKDEGNQSWLVMSSKAHEALTENQKAKIKQFMGIIPIEIPIIEQLGGGSVRCMMTGIFLPVVAK